MTCFEIAAFPDGLGGWTHLVCFDSAAAFNWFLVAECRSFTIRLIILNGHDVNWHHVNGLR